MSYYYEDAGYAEYGNSSNYNDEHEYEMYSDCAKSDHDHHTPSEPDPYEYKRENVTRAEWENEPEGLDYRDHETHEPKPDWEAFERAEIEYRDRGGYQYETEAEGYHPEVPKYEGDNTYQHDDGMRIFAPADHNAVEPSTLSDTMYVPAYPMPVYTHPNSHLPTPTPIPHPRDSPNLNQ
jgi:hypothetical protein